MKESTWSWSQAIRTSPFCAILVQNLDYFWLFEGVRVLKMQKNKVTFVTEPQKVGIIKVTLFWPLLHSNPLKKPKIVQILDQNRTKRTIPNNLGPRPS